MDEALEQRIRFLQEAKTGVMDHSGRGLLDHLLGTRKILVDWGARPAVCDAGLFHSVYGTEAYQPVAIPESMRGELRELIGEEAEALAWLFCMMDRNSLYLNLERKDGFTVQHRNTAEQLPLSAQQLHALVDLTFANTLEQYPRYQVPQQRRVAKLNLKPLRPLAMPEAVAAFEAMCGAKAAEDKKG